MLSHFSRYLSKGRTGIYTGWRDHFQAVGDCGKDSLILGGSSPARSIPLLNNDGVFRLHPQALVRQFNLDGHPNYAPFDILSIFNADAPFWFKEDGVVIGLDQSDFLFVILHEFIHGLGFYSEWKQHLSKDIITPDPTPFFLQQHINQYSHTNTMFPRHFIDGAMDRFLYLLDVKEDGSTYDSDDILPIGEITQHLNKIRAHTLTELVESSEFEVAVQMGKVATTRGTMGLHIEQYNHLVILETSMKPFHPGSSVSHVAYIQYTHSPDFLMRFMQERGMTLDDAIERGGGTGPIGPLLLCVFEQLGYSTINQPNNVPPLFGTKYEFINRNVKGLTVPSSKSRKKDNGRIESKSSIQMHPTTISLYFLFISCAVSFV
ncbi:hypothetical protein BDB01DRAFT_846426 [Pilobolus umbonatus]|nr:hypothetical protein BDB01DRAFT_846426 [Pilobolus umbonatus]